MIDAQGNVAGTALYSPYGKLLQSEGVQVNIAYAGLYHHKESGLYLATYRGYNPFTARWLNRDPIEENGGLNLYEYVGGSPLMFIDTIGLDVYIKSRDVIGLGGTGAHTFISIVDSDNKNTVYGSYKDSEGMNKVLKNVPSDYALAEHKVTSQTLIKPPKGMSQKEWDDKVIQTGEYYLENQS